MNYKRSAKIFTLAIVCAILFSFLFIDHSTFALESSSLSTQIAKTDPDYDGSVDTTFFNNVQDDGQGCGVYTILKLFIDILTYGIAIAASIGLIVSGITYLTAKGNEGQVVKAKKRIKGIVIGLATYLALWSLLNFLLPGGNFNPSNTCKTSNKQTSTFGEAPAYTPSRRENASGASDSSKSKKGNTSGAEKIARTAERLAWPYGTKESKYHHHYGSNACFKDYSDFGTAKPTKAFWEAYTKMFKDKNRCGYTGYGADCGRFVNAVVRASGYDKYDWQDFESYFLSKKGQKKWKKVKSKKAKRGDVCGGSHGKSQFHTKIFLGDKKIAEANNGGKNFGHITTGNCKDEKYIFRPIK